MDSNSNFIDYKTKITVICQEHGDFQITPSHLLGGRGCPTCGKNKKKSLKEIIDLIQKANPYANYDFSQSVYKGIHVPILIKCNKCGTTFKNSPSNLITYKNGCNGCGGSQLELEVKDFLKKNNIKFHREKTFEWLKDKRNLKLDFYLDDYNVAIECQGLQHFEQVCFQKDKLISLDEIKNRDVLKRTLCEKNGVKLFYYANYPYKFPYFVYEDKSKMLNDIKLLKKELK
jgi:predicted  nucleic acid-binding Zn-ribbon protein